MMEPVHQKGLQSYNKLLVCEKELLQKNRGDYTMKHAG